MRNGLLPLITLVLLSCLLLSLQAQEKKSQQPQFKAEAYAGLMEVRVTDQSGKPVTGLKQEDFQVKEDGQPRKIILFRPRGVRSAKSRHSDRYRLDHVGRIRLPGT